MAKLFFFFSGTHCIVFSPWYLQMLADASEGRIKVVNDDILEYNMETMFPDSVKKQWHEGNRDLHVSWTSQPDSHYTRYMAASVLKSTTLKVLLKDTGWHKHGKWGTTRSPLLPCTMVNTPQQQRAAGSYRRAALVLRQPTTVPHHSLCSCVVTTN